MHSRATFLSCTRTLSVLLRYDFVRVSSGEERRSKVEVVRIKFKHKPRREERLNSITIAKTFDTLASIVRVVGKESSAGYNFEIVN